MINDITTGRIMEQITAASNLIIEMQPESWRLLVNGGAAERLLVEALPGEPLHYVPSFGSKRRLPENGSLDPTDIQRIVLGWSEKDASWHLGLVLNNDLSDSRGSRWCGLAHWHDPLANQLQDRAVQAGQMLAQQINRPFTMIPPNVGADLRSTGETAIPSPEARWQTPVSVPTAPASVPAPAEEMPIEPPPREPIPQPDLPLRFELWTLHRETPERLELKLAPSWGRGKLIRVAWNIIWLAVFIVLTMTTLTSGIALPRPELLVYLGFASIAVLVIIILYNLYQTLTYTNRITFDPAGVRWLKGNRVQMTIPIDALQAVYASQVVSKIDKKKDQRSVGFGEINLLLKDGDFKSILVQQQTDDKIPAMDDPLNEEAITSLTEYNARTHLQAAALEIAHALNLPAEYDKRLK